jgi:gamma-glutamyl phosphate reductase
VKYLRVKNAEELVRDTSSSAILNTNNEDLQAYKLRRAKETLIDRIARENKEIKSDLEDIKMLLKELIIGQK